jgi:alpha-mannosidase
MRTVHIVSHTHWDREWYRTFQLFRLKLIHLVDGLLEILEEDKEYKFFMLDGQTIVLDDYLLMRPEKEEILHKYIQKGRILIGPWHILPDMFLVGPEAHIRNLLQGDRTAHKFGPKMMVGYIPDPFGHPGQTPQILRGFGIDTACLWRGADITSSEFWWQAPDGSRVLMAYLRDGYGNGAELPANNLERFASQLAERADSLVADSATPDLLVMYGTDHMEPPHNTSEAIAYADEMLRDTHVIHSTLPHYVAALKEEIKRKKLEIPVVDGELRACRRMHLLPGVLSTRMWIKQRNRASENLMEKWVEPFSVFAGAVTDENPENLPSTFVRQPATLIRQIWLMLMENHPHDSICGCSIDQVHDEMKVRFDQVDQVGEEITRQSLEALANVINTVEDQPPSSNHRSVSALVVFNPLAGPRTDVVNTTLELPAGIGVFDLVDENGASLPYQEHGLGSHEIINVTMDTKTLQSSFGNISDGRAAGMTIQEIKLRREGTDVFIDAILADGGEPNLTIWNAKRKQLDEFFADPSITTYHVLARSTSATQIAITVPDVPGHGYRTLWVLPQDGTPKPPIRLNPLVKALLPLGRLPFVESLLTRKRYARPPYKIENDFFTVEVRQDGTLALLDKRDGKRYAGLNRFLDGGDCGDEYNYSSPTTDRLTAPRLKHVSIARGPVQQVLEIELELNIPLTLATDRKSRSKEQVSQSITTTVTLSHGVPRLDIHTRMNNRARDHRLRVHFPAPFASTTGQHDGHFEVVERGIGLPAFDASWVEQPRPEVPQRTFTSMTDGRSRLTVANRGLPEVEVLKNSAGNAEIALTLLRCVGWLSRDDFSTRNGHAGPFLETPGAQMPGTWEFDYSILPASQDTLASYNQAYAFETPMRAVSASLHSGVLPAQTSLIEVEPAAFSVSAIKVAEDGRGWLVRGYNLIGDEIMVTLKPWRPFKKVEQVNLAEEKIVTLKPDKEGRVTIPVRGHEIVSVMFQV